MMIDSQQPSMSSSAQSHRKVLQQKAANQQNWQERQKGMYTYIRK